MQPTKTVEEFVCKNDLEFKKLVRSICIKFHFPNHFVEDIVQEVYVKFLTTSVFEKYNPEYRLSTWLYPIVISTILRHNKKNKIETRKFTPFTSSDTDSALVDSVEIALRSCQIAREFQCVLDYNESTDGIDGLGACLKEFENKWLGTTGRNRKFKLVKRRDKSVTRKCTMLDVYRLISLGLSNRQIAQHFGCSNVFISFIKQMIVRSLKEYGIRS